MLDAASQARKTRAAIEIGTAHAVVTASARDA